MHDQVRMKLTFIHPGGDVAGRRAQTYVQNLKKKTDIIEGGYHKRLISYKSISQVDIVKADIIEGGYRRG